MEDEVISYLTALLGEKITTEALSASERKRAGWLVNFYALKAATLRGRRHILAFAKAGQHYTPVAVSKQLAMGRAALDVPFVFVPRELGRHDVARLIAANVPFVLAKRSLHLPESGLSVTRAPETPVLREVFSAPAQLLVIGYLLKRWGGEVSIADGMKRTGFSLASIVHAFQEIEHFGAGVRERGADGRSTMLRLKGAGEIWSACRSRFFNPCKRTVGVLACPEGAALAGVDALSRISSLNEDEPTCFALPLKGFRALGLEELAPDTAPCRLQLWHYPPKAVGGDAVDAVSLYLTLADDPDDRVQIELEKLQKEFSW